MGEKYEAVRDLDVTEIAARIRKDIALLRVWPATGREDWEGVRVSVRCRRYAGGQSIDVTLTLPRGERARRTDEPEDMLSDFPAHPRPWLSPRAQRLWSAAHLIWASYNYDKSDSMMDYFDVHYYGGVEVEEAA